jgi:hypothetical protein
MDHLMNLRVAEQFGEYFARLPLKKSPTIAHANALQIDWNEIVPAKELTYILGNPPFRGKKEQTSLQKKDLAKVFHKVKGSGVLDFVACWFLKAAKYMQGTSIKCAFVSTNSITQGEQVAVLWGELYRHGCRIQSAHRTFKWSNEAKGKAAVHCVIIGFGSEKPAELRLFTYDNYTSDPNEVAVKRINAYLEDAPEVLIGRRSKPICDIPLINKGSEATDFGHLFLENDERDSILSEYPDADKWIRRAYGSDEFISGYERYCLWLVGITPDELYSLPPILARVEKVREARLKRSKKRTIEWAARPSLFSENRQPITPYMAIPKVSSERRPYLPIGFLAQSDIATGSLQVVPEASEYHFGILSSTMHMAWMRRTCGRMKSDYQYSNSIVYNNFPWPEELDEKQKDSIIQAAKAVLAARKLYPTSTLARMYDPKTMPPELTVAHQILDRAVDAAYGMKSFKSDADRAAFLFARYQALTSILPPVKSPKPRKPKTN